jgi:alcohol dehydrogenase
MATREVWRIRKAGSLDRVKRESEQIDPPSPGQVGVDVGAVGLNFADLAACLGLYSATPKGPFIPGLEFAGTVEAVGDGVTAFQAGDRVIGLTRFAFADAPAAMRHLQSGTSTGKVVLEA